MTTKSHLDNAVDVLRRHAENRGDHLALTWLHDGELEQASLTFADLDASARAVAARLQSAGLERSRALLLYSPGLDFVTAFYGCLYAGTCAVPLYAPAHPRSVPRIEAVAADAKAAAVLTTEALLPVIQRKVGDSPVLHQCAWIATDSPSKSAAADWRPRRLDAANLAFLQYSSGSTGIPKGVMIPHGGLLADLELLKSAFETSPATTFVSWLPIFHDMGLISKLMHAMFVGARCVLMAPTAFISNPHLWLRAITRYRAAISGGPNFAFDHCARRVTAAQKETLDLSSWRAAYNAAEPIAPQTLNRFCEAFADVGFRREHMYPTYGLAESTVFAGVGAGVGKGWVEDTFSRRALERRTVEKASPGDRDAVALVSCGVVFPPAEVRIVEPESRRACGPGTVGEIWVRGPFLACGYWGRPDETADVFQATLADEGEGGFVRTGDLGFLMDGQLFFSSRLKDLIIVRGRNHYPHDIERTVEREVSALRAGCTAAFALDGEGAERLAIVAEIDRKFAGDPATVVDAMRSAVARDHELEVEVVELVRQGTALKTSSGKIQRRGARDAYLAGKLATAFHWEKVARSGDDSPPGAPAPSSGVVDWIRGAIAGVTGVVPAQVALDRPFAELKLDSVALVELAAAIEKRFAVSLPATALFEYPTVALLAEHVAGQALCSGKPEVERGKEGAEPIAIVGIGCRFPGARGKAEFESLLRRGGDAIREVPPERWDWRAFEPAPGQGKAGARWGGFLEDVERFDPEFFGIALREAERMDPQQRILLELAWETLEDAGVVPSSLHGSDTGVFIGLTQSEYGAMQMQSPSTVDLYVATGGALSVAANRLSYFFNWGGPSLAVDTACSSSLVAIQLACESLRRGDCTAALVGGANLLLSPSVTLSFSQGGATSPDGRCKPFDSSANGMVRSEGAGLVLLMPLSRARAEGRRVYATILGGAINQDGRSNGLTAPNPARQEAVLRKAYAQAGVDPARVQYVEAHGTGTLLGDPIEANALGRVLGAGRPAHRPLAIGSVKSNIGHTEAAAGIAGLIKAALALSSRVIPPSIHYSTPNPHIPFADLKLTVQARAGEFTDDVASPVAGISSFGFGGTNAHVVLEAPPRPAKPSSQRACRPELLVLTARTEGALLALARQWAAELVQERMPFAAAAASAALRREHHPLRLAITSTNGPDASRQLEEWLQNPRTRRAGEPNLAYFFPSGEGAKACAGAEWLATEAVFRDVIARCDATVQVRAGWSVAAALAPASTSSRTRSAGDDAIVAFVVQVALARLLSSWGLPPRAVCGRGTGELAAAVVAGLLAMDSALEALIARAHAVRAHGAPAAVPPAMRAEVAELLRPSGDRSSLPFASAVAGGPVGAAALGTAHWERALFDAPPLSATLRAITSSECTHIVELGVDPTAAALAGSEDACSVSAEVSSCLSGRAGDRENLLALVGRLFVDGASPDWKWLVDAEAPVTDLPTYPFQGKRVWRDPSAQGDTDDRRRGSGSSPSASRSDWRTCLYDVTWTAEAQVASSRSHGETWIILGDPVGPCRALVEECERAGTRCITLAPSLRIDLTEEEDLAGDALRSALTATPSVTRVVHAAALDATRSLDTAGALEEAMARTCRSLVRAARSVRAWPPGPGPRLCVVTCGAQAVLEGDVVSPPQTAAWGLARTIAHELGPRWGGVVDWTPEGTHAGIVRTALVRADGEQRAARGDQSFMARLVHAAAEPSRKSDGVGAGRHLITGGLGSLGLQVAERLVQMGARHLVLVSRRDLPENSDALAKDHPLHDAAVAIRALRKKATVETLAVDVGDAAVFGEALERLRSGPVPVRGVVHCAGVGRLDSLEEMRDRTFDEVVHGKVAGAWTLHRHFGPDSPLDFFVLFSSFSALVGLPRLGHYAAANAFLDGLARRRCAEGLSTLSINWGAWGQPGAVERITPEEGLAAFSDWIGEVGPQRAMSRSDWRALCERYPAYVASRYLEHVAPVAQAAQATTAAVPEAQSGGKPIDDADLRVALTAIVADLLGISAEQVDGRRALTTLGMDSLMAADLAVEVERRFGVSLPGTTLLHDASIETLARLIAEHAVASNAAPPAEGPRRDDPALDPSRIGELADAEVDRLLRAALERGA